MPCRLIEADCPHDESPDDPVLWVVRVQSHCFLDLRYRFGSLSFPEQSEGPLTVTAVLAIWEVHLGGHAHSHCLLEVLVHVVYESQVIVDVLVPWVDFQAYLHVFIGHLIVLLLEVSETQVILKLSILWVELT